ncbi:MAG: alpha/beta hydrolase [Planctomycetota bacterium]
MIRTPRIPALALCALCLAWAAAGPAAAQDASKAMRVAVTFNSKWHRTPQTGSVYLIVTSDLIGEPRFELGSWDHTPWIFRKDVVNLAPGEEVVFDLGTPGFPGRLGQIPTGQYALQAIFDQSLDDPDFAHADGNGRSRLRRHFLDATSGSVIPLEIERDMTRPHRVDLARVRYRSIESRLVGRALGRRYYCDVAVLLPPGYTALAKEGRKFPVQYWIPGNGVRARGALKFFQERRIYFAGSDPEMDTEPFIRVILDAQGPNGHHYWTDSDANGPMGSALFEEVIPALEEEFAIRKDPASRFLVGHGAGGLAAISILLRRPADFAGVYALAPDPLDFRSFFGLDLEKADGLDAFTAADGSPRPFVVRDGRAVVTLKDQARYEEIVHRGGILRSLETSFAKRGRERLFDRVTGRVDPKVARDFLEHDPRRIVARNAASLGPKIDKKIHLAVGDKDDFRLTEPTISFVQELRGIGIRVRLDTIIGAGHRDLDSAKVHALVQDDISKNWRER